MGHLGRATSLVHLISAPDQPGRKRMYQTQEKVRAYCLDISIYWNIIDVHKSTSRVNDYCYDDNSSLSCVLAKKQDLFSALYKNVKWVFSKKSSSLHVIFHLKS